MFTIHSAGECYNPRHDRWLPIAPMSKCRSRAGIVSLGKLIYAIGGYNFSVVYLLLYLSMPNACVQPYRYWGTISYIRLQMLQKCVWRTQVYMHECNGVWDILDGYNVMRMFSSIKKCIYIILCSILVIYIL